MGCRVNEARSPRNRINADLYVQFSPRLKINFIFVDDIYNIIYTKIVR